MAPLNKNLIVKRMKDLDQYLSELQPYISIGLEKYQRDREKRYVAERLIQLIVEVASDINRSIIESKDNAPPDTYYSTFARLNELEILPKELSDRLASTAGLRNRLVHRYEDIEHKIVYHSAVRLLKDYRQYFRLIGKYLQEQ